MADWREEDEREVQILLYRCEVAVIHMQQTGSMRPTPQFEERVRAYVERSILRVRLNEAKRCEAYGQIGSPRVLELGRDLNKKSLQVAKLDLQDGEERPS